jgi:hypothetical protein
LVDLDNDGLLDIFLVMKSKSNKSYVGIIQGDTVIKGTGVAIAIGHNVSHYFIAGISYSRL